MTRIIPPDVSSSDNISTQLFDVVSTTKDAKPFVFSGSALRIGAIRYTTPKKKASLLDRVLAFNRGPNARHLPPEHFRVVKAAGWVPDSDLEVVDRMRDKQRDTL